MSAGTSSGHTWWCSNWPFAYGRFDCFAFSAGPPGSSETGVSTFGIGNGSVKGDMINGLVGVTSV